MTKIYNYLAMYAESLIKKNFIFKLAKVPKKISYHSHNAATLLIEEYYKIKCSFCNKLITATNDKIGHICKCEEPLPMKNNFRISTSFGGFLFTKIKESLWGKKEYDVADDSIDKIYEDGNGNQYENQYSNDDINIKNVKHDLYSLSLLDYIIKVIKYSNNYCENKFINFQRLLALNLYLNKGELNSDTFFRLFGRFGKDEFKSTLIALNSEIKEYGK